jgi:hypothetical protein
MACWSGGMDEQISIGPRSPEYISRLQVFSLSVYYHNLKMESFYVFTGLQRMMISEILAELIFLCYLACELCAIEGVNEEMQLFIHLDYDHSVMYSKLAQ